MTEESLALNWEPTRWEDTIAANHIDRGFYMITPVTWMGEMTQWRVSYEMGELGHHPSIDAAKKVAEVHHATSHRKFLWEAYMASHDPPSDACCSGGPQWGHAWDCPKCPD